MARRKKKQGISIGTVGILLSMIFIVHNCSSGQSKLDPKTIAAIEAKKAIDTAEIKKQEEQFQLQEMQRTKDEEDKVSTLSNLTFSNTKDYLRSLGFDNWDDQFQTTLRGTIPAVNIATSTLVDKDSGLDVKAIIHFLSISEKVISVYISTSSFSYNPHELTQKEISLHNSTTKKYLDYLALIPFSNSEPSQVKSWVDSRFLLKHHYEDNDLINDTFKPAYLEVNNIGLTTGSLKILSQFGRDHYF